MNTNTSVHKVVTSQRSIELFHAPLYPSYDKQRHKRCYFGSLVVSRLIVLHLVSLILVDCCSTVAKDIHNVFYHDTLQGKVEAQRIQVSAQPSLSPVPTNPSKQPSLSPNERISLPSLQSSFPSRTPTNEPLDPTPAPAIAEPTVSPVTVPVPVPIRTRRPTNRPTRRPTTRKPTDEPTISPTLDPTNFPTESPTSPPILEITALPSISISISPTLSAFGQSDPSPTLVPIRQPSVSPSSLSPTRLVSPSVAPSQSYTHDKKTFRVRDVRFLLTKGTVRRILQQSSSNNELDMNCTDIWKSSIQERITAETVALIQRYETLMVEVRDTSVSTNATVISILFNIHFEIRSSRVEDVLSNDNIASQLVLGPFDTQAERKVFVEHLRSTECMEFHNVTTISLVVPSMMEEQSTNKSHTSSAALYAGLGAGSAAIIMMGITIFYYLDVRNKRRIVDVHTQDNTNITPSKYHNNNNHHHHHYNMDHYINTPPYVPTPSIIDNKSKNSDISTLGDPIPFGTCIDRNDGDVSTTGSFSLEYDYKKAFVDTQSYTDSQIYESVDEITMKALLDDPMTLSLNDDIITTAGDETTTSSHNNTLPQQKHQPPPLPIWGGYDEEQIEVVVPPGMLGLILESNMDDGRPTVYNIKPNSILSLSIVVGDRLDIVDGIIVSNMTAYDVSKLISMKKDQVRVLVFSRPMKRKSYRCDKQELVSI